LLGRDQAAELLRLGVLLLVRVMALRLVVRALSPLVMMARVV